MIIYKHKIWSVNDDLGLMLSKATKLKFLEWIYEHNFLILKNDEKNEKKIKSKDPVVKIK